MDKHTPTPWVKDGRNILDLLQRQDRTGLTKIRYIVECSKEADAAFIVRAVNTHYALVAFIERLVAGAEGFGPDVEEKTLLAQAKALIAKTDLGLGS